MPVSYRIDTSLRAIFSTAHGVLTGQDLMTHRSRLASDPEVEPDLRQLWDFRRVTEVRLTKEELREIVRLESPFGWGARRAWVAGSDVDYGMLHMFQLLRDESVGEIRIFRDVKEARHWLGLPDEGD